MNEYMHCMDIPYMYTFHIFDTDTLSTNLQFLIILVKFPKTNCKFQGLVYNLVEYAITQAMKAEISMSVQPGLNIFKIQRLFFFKNPPRC